MQASGNLRRPFGQSPGSPRWCGVSGAASWVLLCLLSLLVPALQAQEPVVSLDGIRKQLNLRQSLSCSVRTGFPVLLFDFKMHSPFVVTLPMKPLKESEQIFVRVWTVPVKDLDGRPFPTQKSVHFLANRSSIADLKPSGNHFLQVNGSVATGAGEFRHYLSVDDGKGLGCVKEWKVKAKPERALLPELALKPGEATDPRLTAFIRQRAVPKQESGIRVAVMLNVDNRSWRRVITDSNNMIALAAALRKVAEDERVREVALAVFSLEDQNVFFDQEYNEVVDFRRLGIAFRQMKPGQVEVSKLSLGSEARFLAGILREREGRLLEADLILFVGARSPVSDKVPPAALESLRPGNRTKVAYLVTNPFRWRSPVNRDVIGHAVKALGGAERDIRLPGDLTKAVNQMVRDSMRNVEAPAAQ
ncbi:MAG: hypothetical protein KIT83_13185 [Bryobacterales bacterium]|nr:hypothetical protein [Bryobacterales bacterium]